MSDADGIGTIMTGGIVARELDHAAAGHGADGAGGACLNCGTVRVGGFCHACGQSGHIHRNIAALGHDIAHGVFHFEGRIWKTLPMLALRPGELTRRYVHGQRARFVSPMALFLFSVFLLFAAVNRVSMPDVAGASQGLAKAQVQISADADKARDKLATLTGKRGEALALDPKADVKALDRQIADARSEVAALNTVAARIPVKWTARPGSSVTEAVGEMPRFDSGVPGLDSQIAHVKANPALYAYKLKMASYKFSWVLIPISVPFIWLLFCLRRDVGLYDHAIFAIYSLSFMTLFVVALIALYLIGIASAPLWLAFLFVPPIHMYKQLKGAYRIGRFAAFWRMGVLLVMTSITSTLFFLLLLWLEAE